MPRQWKKRLKKNLKEECDSVMTYRQTTLGIIGMGFVGKAVHATLKKHFPVITYDKYATGNSMVPSVAALCEKTCIIFVCVPTPMLKNGACDVSIVESVCAEIAECKERITVIIKSTVIPGTTHSLNKKYDNLSVIFNPEFLTEANAVRDFRDQERIIIGNGRDRAEALALLRIYETAFPTAKIILTDSTAAEMLKYCTNTFLALKVSFANEIYQICKAQDINYKELIELVMLDKRIGSTHWKVPGPMPASDNSGRMLPGFSGSCFVKDINALIYHAEKLGVDPKVLLGAWQKNLEVRPERDWEMLKGRAVADSEKA